MNPYDFPPIAAALDAAYSFVSGLAVLLEPVAGAGSAAAAIVLVTMLVRTVLIPVGIAQGRAEITRRRLAPMLRDLQRRHAKNPERLQRATMQLYADEKASPLAGCLPVLIQAPIVSLLYGLFVHTDIAGHGNALLAAELSGVPLGQSFVWTLGTGIPLDLIVFGVLLAVIATVSFVSRRVALRQADPDAAAPAIANVAGALSWLPFLTVVFAAFVPLAATIYLAITTTWTLVERLLVRRILLARAG